MSTAISTCEAMTLLKQYEQALPGRDLSVEVEWQEWDHQRKDYVERVSIVPITHIKWGSAGPVLVSGRVE